MEKDGQQEEESNRCAGADREQMEDKEHQLDEGTTWYN